LSKKQRRQYEFKNNGHAGGLVGHAQFSRETR
jgi:hypothetical protein